MRGVGYPKPDRSHFRSMDIWQTANPDRPGNTGWLGRWLDTRRRRPAPGRLVRAGAAAAAGRRARAPAPRSRSTGPTLPKGVDRRAARRRWAKPSAGEPPLQARAAACFADLIKVDEMITEVKDAAAADDDDDDDDPAATGTGGGRTPLDAQLDLVAQCVEAGVSTRVFSVSLGGFDFHADEKPAAGAAPRRTGHRRVGASSTGWPRPSAGRKVIVLVYSEFGRRVRANASDGTDHGTASNVFVARPRGRRRPAHRRPAEPDRPRQRRPQVHHRLPRRLRRHAHRRARAPTRGGSSAETGHLTGLL